VKSLRRLRDRVAGSTDGTAPSAGDPDGGAGPGATPPAGAVVAAYAAVLDGRHLWVAVDDRPGRLALRDTTTGQVLAAAPDARADGPTDEPGFLSAVLPLDGVGVGADHDVVVVGPDPATLHPVWTARPPASATPPAADGRSRVVLDRGPEGLLRVRREALPGTAVLRTVSARPDGLALHLDDPAAALAVHGQGGEPVVVAEPVDGLLLLTDGPLRDLPAGMVRLVAVTGTDVRPVRRHADDLAEPGRSVPLPELRDATTDLPRLRLRWGADSHLAARLVDGEDDA